MFSESLILSLLHGRDNLYLYDEAAMLDQCHALAEALPGVRFLYSVKANPHPRVTGAVFSQGFGADAASLGEVRLAAGQGLGPGDIYYSAPGKTAHDVAAALPLATLVADSLGEVELIRSQAAQAGRTVRIGLRVNPGFSFGGGEGAPSKFGVDEDQALAALPEWNALPNVEIVGLHVHLKSQELHAGVLAGYYGNMLALARRFQAALGRPLEFLNLGSGIGIPYAPADRPVDLSALRESVDALRAALPGTRLFIETGRYVVGKAGVYVTRVADKKVSHGKTFVILKGTLNGFLRPSLAQLARGQADAPRPAEPLFTGPDAFQFLPIPRRQETETVTLAGDLCTAADVVAQDVTLPRMEVGDAVVVTNAGSYAATLSPTAFSSQTPPAELVLGRDGRVI